jgi:protocatechuate 3,4-dioxygenase beta subunit
MTSRSILPALALGLALAAAACGSSSSSSSESGTPTLAPPAATRPAAGGSTAALQCTPPATPTTSQTEGPYYVPGAPERADLVDDGVEGTVLELAGYVVDTDCTPLANAKVDVWQADARGEYDNSGGYRLRGYVLTDAAGRWSIRTIVPGEYPGRTEHIHVKITPEGGFTLTSQLYFPGSTANEGDGIFSPDLQLDIAETADGLDGTFTFVIDG